MIVKVRNKVGQKGRKMKVAYFSNVRDYDHCV